MFNELLSLVFQSIEFLWPLHIVSPWERSVRSIVGRWTEELGPGIYLKIPWFIDFHDVTIVADPITTGRRDVTLKDGRVLVFEATAMAYVTDASKAVLAVHDHDRGTHAILAGVFAEKLSNVDPDRLLPEGRGRLNGSLKVWVDAELAEIGVATKWVRFTTFVLHPKTIRLLGENTAFIG